MNFLSASDKPENPRALADASGDPILLTLFEISRLRL
jgi:hypothetical protein